MDQIKTGALIRTLRLKRGMTQLALAEMIGVNTMLPSSPFSRATR